MTLATIDWELGTKLTGKKKFAVELLDLLVQSLPGDLIKIKQAQDHAQLCAVVHKLHGAVCYCGTPRLKAVLSKLETDLKTNIISDLTSHLIELDTAAHLLLEQHPAIRPK